MKLPLCFLIGLCSTLALAFDCPPGFCDSVDCSGELTAITCKGRLGRNSSLCGCCSACFVTSPYLGECHGNKEAPNEPPFLIKVCPSMSVCFNEKCLALPH